jgi:hypothetical protein
MEPEKNKARKFKAKFMHCELELILIAGMEINSRDTELRGTQTFTEFLAFSSDIRSSWH